MSDLTPDKLARFRQKAKHGALMPSDAEVENE